jgi:PA14 domain/HYR domain/Ricin-type beta-trefoil lectin domain-like/Secretion system C-terminal sorting domain
MNQHKLMSLMRFTMIFCLTLAVGILRGQTQFIGPANGDWFTVANWNNGLPAVGNDANISGGASVVIGAPLTAGFQIQNFGTITNNSTLTINSSFISGGALVNTGTMTISAGASMTSSGGFTNSGTLTNKGSVNSNSAFANSATGVVNNESNFQQGALFTNDGIVSNKAGNFTCPQTFTNNKTVENLATATFTVDFGGAFTNATGSTLANAGTFRNFASFTNNTTVTNTGQYANSGTHTCNGIFNNENAGRFESGGTVNLTGRWNNKVGSTTQSSNFFNVVTNGFFDNFGTFQNNNKIDVKVGGTFCNEAAAVVNSLFGSSIVNAGYIKTQASSKIVSNGEINNSNLFLNSGIIESNDGAKIINSDSLINTSIIKNVNVITNTGYFENNSTIENMSGAVWTNSGTFLNTVPGIVLNGFEIYNKPGASFFNNGTVKNNIRLFNEGAAFVNNGYLATSGDIFNRVGATLTNTEVLEIFEGSMTNEGTFDNRKTVIVRKCGIISNKATINNTGTIRSEGIVLQRGTLTGNAVVKVTGFVITSPSSETAGLCKPVFRSGTDVGGRAKVDAAQVILPTVGVDSCFGIQYFINGLNRSTYGCPEVGTTIPGRLKLILRTGDSLTCNTSIEVFDGVAPVIANCPQDVTVYALIDSAAFSWPTITAVDNCPGAVTFTSTNASGSFFKLGVTKVTVSARDGQNNNADCIFNVDVQKVTGVTATCPTTDNTAPVFANCPANITLTTAGFSAVASWNTPSVSDNCYPIYVRVSQLSGTSFPKGATTVTYTGTDSKNNVGVCSFTVTVNGGDPCLTDNVKPTISNCPPNVFLINNTANNNAVAVWREPSATDNCFGAVLTSTLPSGSLFPAGSTTAVVYTARDGAGNTSTCSFNVQVSTVDPCAGDVAGPVFAGCPTDLTVSTTTLTGTATWAAPTATDACGGVVINSSHAPGNNFSLGSTIVTYQASDRKGNLSFCSFKVTVVNACLSDTIKPVLSACPANIAVTSTNGTNATATWTAPTATDNCSAATVTSNFASGTTFPIGLSTVTYTATDQNGNNAKCSFTVTVSQNPCATDTQAPTFANCPTNISLTTAGTTAAATWTAPTASDNCSTPTVTLTTAPTANLVSGSQFPVGSTTVTYRAVDAKGNAATCVFTVAVTQQVTGGNCTGGLKGSYFNVIDLTGTPVLVRTDATVNYDWGTGSPAPSVNVDHFSVRWDGQVEAPATGAYTFTVRADDGIRLWVNNVLLIDKWIDQAPTEWSGSISLTAGQKYAIKIEYYERGGGSVAQLSWAYPGQVKQIIPTSRLCSTPPCVVTFDPTKCYKIVNKATGKVIDVTNFATGDNAPVSQWTSNGGTNQQWQIVPSTVAGFIELRSRHSGDILANHNAAIGSACYMWHDIDNIAKRWKIECNADGSYKITNQYSNKIIEVLNSSTVDGAKIVIGDYSGAANEQWLIQETVCGVPSPCVNNGNIIVERWNNHTDWTFPLKVPITAASVVNYQGNTQGPWNIGDNYFTRVRGFIRPDKTGGHAFNITGDDHMELFISTDASPANMRRVAYHQGWTSELEYSKYPTQTALNISLSAGKLYYFELRHKEGGGGDGWRISWCPPGITAWQPIPSQNLARPCSTTYALAYSAKFAFEAKADINQAKLSWLSNGGLQNDYFVVERSSATSDFEAIERVNAKNVNGELKNYNFTDTNPFEGDNYYRIKTVQLDGEVKVSDIKTLTFGKVQDVRIFPNPASEYIDVDLKIYEGKQVNVYIYNAMGKLVKTTNVESATSAPQHIDIDNLTAGSYLIRIQVDGKRDVTKQVQITN